MAAPTNDSKRNRERERERERENTCKKTLLFLSMPLV